MKPIMLALSTFRHSANAVDVAIEKADKGKHLVIVYVCDVNLARYLIGLDITPDLKEKCEEELLKEHKETAERRIAEIAAKAEKRGIRVSTHVYTGRFALECLRVIGEDKPEVVVTTRSKRPEWIKRFFGSPVDYLIENAGCPVIEA